MNFWNTFAALFSNFGALTWQMYVYFARYIAALQSLPALVLFIAAGFGIIFGLNFFSVKGFGEAEFWCSLIKVITVLIFIAIGVLMVFGIMNGSMQPDFANFSTGEAPFVGGIPAISAMCVIFVGILGAVFGHTLLNGMRIHTKAARGLSMGTASHALGTARCAELDYQEGAFSSLALVICGIITSLVAPFLFPIILAVVG